MNTQLRLRSSPLTCDIALQDRQIAIANILNAILSNWLKHPMPAYSIQYMLLFAGSLLLLCSGCYEGHTDSLDRGTVAIIHFRGQATGDLQINVHQSNGSHHKRIAFGVSDSDGIATLIDDKGQSSFTLGAGRYCITVESVSADPIPVPSLYGSPATTPIIKVWTAAETSLLIDVH